MRAKPTSFFLIFTLVALSNFAHAGLGDLFDDIGDKISDGIDDISNGVDDVANSISNKFDDLFKDAGLAIASKFFGVDLTTVLNQLNTAKQGSNNGLQSVQIMDIFNGYNITELCDNCQELVKEVRDHGEHSVIRKLLKEAFQQVCEDHIQSAVCSAYVTSFGDIIIDSMRFEGVSPTQVCQRYAMCPYPLDQDALNSYVQEVLQGKPAPNIPAPTNRSTYTVLHITDIHIDFLYQEGTNANCGGFQCCRAEYGIATDPAQAAGYWGSVGICDLPLRTVEQFMQFARSNFNNLSMIIWTGDNIDHQLWDQFEFNQTVPTNNITQDFRQNFPNTTVYPMFGNHEAFPSDQYDTVGSESAWIPQETGQMWVPWLDAQALSTFQQKSYYSEVNTALNLKVISLDTQTCDTLNFYLIRDTSGDPLGQLDWLQQELTDAENRNLSVFIMGHIPPGSLNCDPQWSGRYRALVDRFSNIIRAQFYGHTHNDQFQVVRSYADNSPIGAIYVAPSLSTYISLNPSFRVYEFDADTNVPVNYYQYRLDLDKWNTNTVGPIEWDLVYNFLEEYSLPDMTFGSFDALAEKIKADPVTAQTYNFNFNSGGISTNATNQREIDYNYCSAKYSTPEQVMQCLGLDPAKTDLLYFAASYVPGLLTSGDNNSTNSN